MKRLQVLAFVGSLGVGMAAMAASAADKVVIGDIDDMSGPYADVIGPDGIEAIKMAIADFGGSVLGQPIELLTVDHQNKPDLGAQKSREWADQNGLTMLLGGSNTGVSLAINAVIKEKKVPFFAIGAAGASLTGKDCTPYTIHYAYDTDRARQRHGEDDPQTGRQVVVLPHRRLRLRHAAAERRDQRGDRERRHGGRIGAGAARNFGLRLLPVAGAEFGRAGSRPRQRRHRLLQFAEGGQRIRHRQDDEAGGAARLPHRHQRHRPRRGPGPLSHHRLVLGPQRQDARHSPSGSSPRPTRSRRSRKRPSTRRR